MTPPIMRFILAQQYSRRTLALAVAGSALLVTVSLVCAGSGLAGALAPLPSRKPDSVQMTSSSTAAKKMTVSLHDAQNSSLRSPVPYPPVKPKRALDADHVDPEDMSAMAASLGLVEPASYKDTSYKDAGRDAPLPVRKPDFAVPSIATLLNYGAAPKPKEKPLSHATDSLQDKDAALYRRIFAAQAAGDWETADGYLRQISDMRLRGHVLYQRYMHPSYKSRFEELRAWMELYSDLPNADRIYRLANIRKPAGYKGTVRKSRNQIGVGAGVLTVLSANGDSYSTEKKLNKGQRNAITRLTKAIRADIGRGMPTRALKRLGDDPASKLMDNVEYDRVRAQIASAYLLLGKVKEARSLAAASAKRSAEKAPMAGWTGGLAAWRQKDYKESAAFFEQTARSSYSGGWMKSAGAYWASRAHTRSGDTKQVSFWLREAAKHPRSFYGMIATRALGWDFDFDWEVPDFTASHYRQLVSIPAAARGMALVQAGQNHLAEAELLQVNASRNSDLKAALLAYTQHVNLPSLALRLASATAKPDGSLYDAALYPLLPWVPEGGYTIDRALVFAITRQESRYNTWAESGSGATGLMQIMPATASYVMKTQRFKEKAGKHHLKDPETNLAVGQKYLGQLLEYRGIDNELMNLAIAYNAGPGNLRKWQKDLADIDDPLLFIEMIPMAETRNYVERVMANYWIYRMRLNQPMPSLESVAEGKWASYSPMDDHGATVRLANSHNRAFRVADRGK